jgi:hypothetical protein
MEAVEEGVTPVNFYRRLLAGAGFASLLLALIASGSAHAGRSQEATGGTSGLKVSANGRYLVQNGKPFFWLGDTVWSLFTLYSPQEAEVYLKHRRQQGFTVEHTMIAFNGGPGLKTRSSNPEGYQPWLNANPATPNEAFFKNVDHILDVARQEGLFVVIMPCGGSSGSFVNKDKVFTRQNVRAYGKWLGRRYKDVPNIIWGNGFDLEPWEYVDVAQELAAGLREGDGGAHLITYHPSGGNSSSYFQEERWLDFNIIQTWSDYWRSNPMVLADYSRLPVKPVVMAEGAYEEGPEYPSRPITPLVVRKEANWSFLGGGFHTYGHNDMWRHNPAWRQSMDSPGAQQMGILKKIFAGRQWWKLAPDPSVFVLGAGSDKTLNAAARSTDGDNVVVYLSSRTTVTIDLSKITAGNKVRATWVNPETGEQTSAGEFPHASRHQFTTPGPGEDAVLLLDAKAAR